MILSATKDFVPIEGTWEAFREAKRVYTQLGYAERVALVEANEKHGFSYRLREAAVRFFAHWLQGRQIEVFEDDQVPVRSDAELQVTPEGQVRKMKGERSILELYDEYERQLAGRRAKLTRAVVRKVTGIRPLQQLPKPRVEIVAADESPTRIVLHPEPGIVLPALHWPKGRGVPVLIAPDTGLNSAVTEAERLHAQGHPVLLVDVRDTGETKTRNWRFEGADYYIAYMLGRCWLAMRAEDLLVCARWLAAQQGTDSVRVVAAGEIGPAALHAAALEPMWITSVFVDDGLTSWRHLLTDTNAYAHLHNAVHGALRHYDLPDLRNLVKPVSLEY